MRAERLLRAAWLLGCLLEGALPARAGEVTGEVGGVRVTAGSYWPSTLNRGWQPLLVEVVNTTDDERFVELTFRGHAMLVQDVLERGLRVPARTSERIEVAVPARPSNSNAYMLQVRAAGELRHLGTVGAEQASGPQERIVLWASRAGPSAVDTAALAAALSAEAQPRVPSDETARRIHGLGYGGVVRPRSAGAASDNVRAGGAAYEHLAQSPEAYTSLHALILDVEGGNAPPRAALDAALAWVRSGGVVCVAGRGARELVRKEAALERWARARFRVGLDGPVESFACGLGLLVVVDGDAHVTSGAVVAALNAAAEALAPLDAAARRGFELEIPGIDVPLRPLTLLLVLFALLVGPVNLILVRRSRRPALLLLTIPGLALLFALGLVGYGIVAQGLDIRATSSTVGVLDQRARQGSIEERRQLFAGLATGPGLVPGPGTAVLRVDRAGWDFRDRREYRIEHGEVVALGGSWLPVRTSTPLRVTTDRAARGRVELARASDGWLATNGLESQILFLVYRDPEGELHAFPGPIELGGTAASRPATTRDADVASLFQARVLARDVLVDGPLPRGAWLARLARSPLVDPLGLDYEEVRGDHVLLGVLDLEGGR
ncbi:MAG: hypothetical protein JNK02_05425 [Planctomycetes bacterium]|nr:hypothetical protein [Planctomycetota bacterium]